MLDLIRLIWAFAFDLFRSRAALEAEVLVLRQQIVVLRRGRPARVPFHEAQPAADAVAWYSGSSDSRVAWEPTPDHLIRDRDAYGEVFVRRVRSLGIRDQPISPKSPWQNGYAERLIGSIRRECLDHIVVVGERHLRHVLLSYMEYYNKV